MLQLHNTSDAAAMSTLTAAFTSAYPQAAAGELSPFRSSVSNCLWEADSGEPVPRDLPDEVRLDPLTLPSPPHTL